MAKLERIIFDAIQVDETEKGVVYFRSNDRAQKETIVRRHQIVQQFEIGESDKSMQAKRKIARLKSQIRYWRSVIKHYADKPAPFPTFSEQNYIDKINEAEDEILRLERITFDADKQTEEIENEYFEWCVMDASDGEVHRSNMTKAEAIEWVREWEEEVAPQAVPGLFYVARRPVGVWEKYDGLG